jgi:hypothetical protein
MFRMTSHLAAPAAVLLMGSTASFALTADEVWQSWKDAGAAAGLEVTAATENNAGGVLTLNGVSIAPAGGAGITISDMTLTEASDGSVSIVPGADIGVAMAGETTGTVKVTHDGLTMVAREADGGVAYDYTAAKLDVVYDTAYPGVSFDGSEAPEVKAAGTFGFANLAGVYSDTPGDNRTFGLDLTADTLAYTTSSDDPTMELKQTTTSETQGIELSFDLTLPTSMSAGGMTAAPADFGAALQEGLAISFTSKQGESTGTMNQESPYMPMALTIKAGGGEASGQFNKDVLSLTSTGSGLQIDGTSGMLPVPVTVTSGPVEFGFNMPVTAVDVAGDYSFLMKLSQFSLNEEAWGLFDPQGALVHDAADLAIDISGKTKIDVPAMIAASETGAVPPVPAPESLDITELSLKLAGAALGATGAFTFDNSMGMPMPLGEANVTVTGATQLIDGLIATGLITEDDAMGARMMMGMFMAPGAGEDELTSKIEMKEGFAIFVNGQQIQ